MRFNYESTLDLKMIINIKKKSMKKAGIIIAIIAIFTISCLVNMKPLVKNEKVQYSISFINKIANAQTGEYWSDPISGGTVPFWDETCKSCDFSNGQTGMALTCLVAWAVCSNYGSCGYGYC